MKGIAAIGGPMPEIGAALLKSVTLNPGPDS